jgi:hypothetical protein
MFKAILLISISSIYIALTNGFNVALPTTITKNKSLSLLSLSSATTSPTTINAALNPGSKFYQLEELEDKEACTTEVFLNKNGSITLTETNGPPPVSSSGSWSYSYNGSGNMVMKMKIVRTYGTGNASSGVGEFTFDVERNFVGDVSLVGGLVSVTGAMIMEDDFFGDTEVGFFSMIDTTDAKLGEE